MAVYLIDVYREREQLVIKCIVTLSLIQLKNYDKKPKFQAFQSHAVGPEIAPLTTSLGVDDSVHELPKHAGIFNILNFFL